MLWGLLAVAGAAVLLATASMVFGWRVPAPEQFLACGGLALLYLATALGCAVAMERGRAPMLMRSGIYAGAVSLAFFIAAVFLSNWTTWWVWQKAIVWPTAWACLMLLIGILLLPRGRGGWWTWLRRAAIALLSLLAAHICLSMTFYMVIDTGWWVFAGWGVLLPAAAFGAWLGVVRLLRWGPFARQFRLHWIVLGVIAFVGVYEFVVTALDARWLGGNASWETMYRYEDMAFRIGIVLGLLAGGASAATFLTLWMPALGGRGRSDEVVYEFELRCPRCGLEQRGQTGGCTCRRCGLSIKVEPA
jgi:hypothetical protein